MKTDLAALNYSYWQKDKDVNSVSKTSQKSFKTQTNFGISMTKSLRMDELIDKLKNHQSQLSSKSPSITKVKSEKDFNIPKVNESYPTNNYKIKL